MSPPDWSIGIAPASATVECGAESHTVEWRDGRFSVPAHADPEGERALAALGGQPCACVQLLDAWERHAADPLVLVLGPRGRSRGRPSRGVPRRRRPGALRRAVPVPAVGWRGGAGWWSYPGAPGASIVTGEPMGGLELLLGLDGEIPHRLVAGVAAALVDRSGDPALGPTLHAALYGRLLATFWRWPEPATDVTLHMSHGEAGLVRNRDGELTATLPFTWLTEVWARELELVDGELTLSAHPGAAGTWELVTVDRDMAVHTRRLARP
jgi:hypothetical protein